MNKVGLTISQILLLLLLLAGGGAINLCSSTVPQVPEALIVCRNVDDWPNETRVTKLEPRARFLGSAVSGCVAGETLG